MHPARSHCPRCDAFLIDTPDGRVCPSCTLAGALGFGAGADEEPDAFPRPFGGFELLGEVGRGGMGLVFRARQLSLGRVVALKVLLHGTFSDGAGRKRFRAEAETAARLQHPNIVAVHEVGEHEGVPYLIMDYVDGSDLGRFCNGRPLKPSLAAKLVRDIAAAVQAAHDAGVLHRDLKPGNILMGSDGRPRVTDFGLAKRSGTDSAIGTTIPGQMLGSPSYASPEQAGGKPEQISIASDVYGLGAVLYHLITGRAPFVAATATQTLRLVLETEPVPPRQLNPGVPRDLETICLKCLQKTPAQRYATAAALADDLGRFLENRPIRARPISPFFRALRWCRLHPSPSLLSAALIAALTWVVVISRIETHRTERARALAQDAERAAVASRNDAEKLVTWLLDDLCEDLDKSGRREQVVKLARQAVVYYENLPQQSRSADTERRHGKALLQLALALDAQASYPESEQRGAQAVAILERLYKTRDGSEATLVCLVHVKMLEVIAQGRRGEARAALETTQATLDLVEPIANRPGSSFELRCSLAWVLRAMGFACDRLGEVGRAADFFGRAAVLHRSLVQMPEAGSDVLIESASALLALNRVLHLTGIAPEEFRAQIEETAAAMQRLVDQGKGGLRAMTALARLQDGVAWRFVLELNPTQSWRWRRLSAQTWERCQLLDPDQVAYEFNITFSRSLARFLQAAAGDVTGALSGWAAELDECSRFNGASFSYAGVAMHWRYLAIWLANLGDREGANHALAQQRLMFTRAYGDEPGETTYFRADAVRLLTTTARVALLFGDLEAARKDALRARSLTDRSDDLGVQADNQRREAESILLWAALISGEPLIEDIRTATAPAKSDFDQRCEYGDRLVPLAILLAKSGRREEAGQILAPAVEFFRRHLASNPNHPAMLEDLAFALFAQALAEPPDNTEGRVALLDETSRLIAAMTDEYRALRWVRLLEGWVALERRRAGAPVASSAGETQ